MATLENNLTVYFFKDFINLFLERRERWEKERYENTDVWETLIGCLSHVLQLGTEPATQAVP